jgi:hypothetical protein
MGQRGWWLVRSLWQHDVVSVYCKLGEMQLYVNLAVVPNLNSTTC